MKIRGFCQKNIFSWIAGKNYENSENTRKNETSERKKDDFPLVKQ